VKAALLALVVVLAAWLAGGLLMANGHTVLGMIIGFVSLPLAVGIWVTASDRI
jgi:hypothetical protein